MEISQLSRSRPIWVECFVAFPSNLDTPPIPLPPPVTLATNADHQPDNRLTHTHRKSLPIRAMPIHEPRNPNPLNHRPLDPTRAFYQQTLSQHQPHTEISRNTRQFKVILRGGVVDTLAENGSIVNQSYRGSNMYNPSGISCRQKQKKKKKKKDPSKPKCI